MYRMLQRKTARIGARENNTGALEDDHEDGGAEQQRGEGGAEGQCVRKVF